MWLPISPPPIWREVGEGCVVERLETKARSHQGIPQQHEAAESFPAPHSFMFLPH